MPTDTALRRRTVPFEAMPGFPDLYCAYCTDFDRVADYFAGDWQDADARRDAAARAAAFDRERNALADILLDQNARWGLDDATRHHIEALREADTVAVVTGQQVGLLGGPLYTPLKTITTLQLARRIADETGRPVVPIFWLEGGDHDLAEVAHVRLLRHNEVVDVRYSGHTLPDDGNLGPVGRLRLTAQIGDVLDAAGEALSPSDFHESLMDALRETYAPGVTLLDAFAGLMRRLFPEAGLVFIDPDDARLKRLVAPLFRREIEQPTASTEALRAVSERLAQDFHAQVHPRATNLFLIDGNGRYPLETTAEGFVLRGTKQRFSQQELLDLLDAAPERFSPNVVLRPLMQDLLLPTAAYVGGPGEVSYFAQFKPVYEWAGVPMPIVYPRASATLVEGKVQKVLDKYDLAVPHLSDDLDRLFGHIVKGQMAVDVDPVFGDATRALHQMVNALKPQVEDVDRTLGGAAEALRASLAKELDRFKGRVVKAEKQQHDALRAQLEKAQAGLFPDGVLQERVLSVLYFLNKYGFGLLDALDDTLLLDTSAHQIVEL